MMPLQEVHRVIGPLETTRTNKSIERVYRCWTGTLVFWHECFTRGPTEPSSEYGIRLYRRAKRAGSAFGRVKAIASALQLAAPAEIN